MYACCFGLCEGVRGGLSAYGAASMSLRLGRREGESRYGDSLLCLLGGLPPCLRGKDILVGSFDDGKGVVVYKRADRSYVESIEVAGRRL